MEQDKLAGLQRQVEEADQALAAMEAVAASVARDINELRRETAEDLGNVPLDELDKRAKQQAAAQGVIRAYELKLAELNRRLDQQRATANQLHQQLRAYTGLDQAQEAYALADQAVVLLEQLIPIMRKTTGVELVEEIRHGCPMYSPPFSMDLIERLEHVIEVYDDEAALREKIQQAKEPFWFSGAPPAQAHAAPRFAVAG